MKRYRVIVTIIILVTFLFLSACEEMASKEVKEEGSPEQIEILNEYKNYNNEDKADMVIYKHYKKFIENYTSIEVNDEIRNEYSRAVAVIFNKNINDFYKNSNSLIDYFSLNDKTYRGIMDNKEKIITELKANITDQILTKKYTDNQKGKYDYLALEDVELSAMLEYADGLNYLSKGGDKTHLSSSLYGKISPDYEGKYSKEIRELILSSEYITEEIWRSSYYGIETVNSSFIPITIGLTDQEVLNKTTWGKPNRINKTETAYGIREQWVYDRGYLYFEDGYLTSIQTSR